MDSEVVPTEATPTPVPSSSSAASNSSSIDNGATASSIASSPEVVVVTTSVVTDSPHDSPSPRVVIDHTNTGDKQFTQATSTSDRPINPAAAATGPQSNNPINMYSANLQHSHGNDYVSPRKVSDSSGNGNGHGEGANVAGVYASVVNMLSFIVGGSILPIPYAFSCAGIVGGTLLLLLVWFINASISYLIIDCIRITNCSNYEALVQMVLGRRARRILDINMILLLFGGVIGGMVVVQDLAHRTLLFGGYDHFLGDKTPIWMAVFAGIIVWPLASLRRLDALSFTNSFNVGTLVLVSGCVIYASIAAGVPALKKETVMTLIAPLNAQTLLAFPIFSFSFFYTPVLFPIYTELANKQDFPRVMRLSCLGAFVIYSTFGIFGYMQFGQSTSSDLLLSFPADAPLTFAMTLTTYLNTVMSYPVGQYNLRVTVTELWTGHDVESEHYSTWRHAVVALIALVGCTTFAFLLPDIAVIFSLTGATCVTVICFVFPTLVYMRLHSPHFQRHIREESMRNGIITSHSAPPLIVSVSRNNKENDGNANGNGTSVGSGPNTASSAASNSITEPLIHEDDIVDDNPAVSSLESLLNATIPTLSSRHTCRVWTVLVIGVICSGVSLISIIPTLADIGKHKDDTPATNTTSLLYY